MSNTTNSATPMLETLSEEELAQVDGGITTTQFYCGVLGAATGMLVGTALTGATFGVGGPVASFGGFLVGSTVAAGCIAMLEP